MKKAKYITSIFLFCIAVLNISNIVFAAQTSTRTDDIKEPPFKYDTKNNENNTKTPKNNRGSNTNTNTNIKDKPNFVDPFTIKDPPYNRNQNS